jgi:hypothetical protein
MRRDQCRVDVDRQPLRHTTALPEPLASSGVRRAQGVQQARRGCDPVDDAERGRPGRHRPEQRVLVADRAEIGHTLPAIGEHHREIANHATRIMTTPTRLQHRKPQRERARQPHLVGDARQ